MVGVSDTKADPCCEGVIVPVGIGDGMMVSSALPGAGWKGVGVMVACGLGVTRMKGALFFGVRVGVVGAALWQAVRKIPVRSAKRS